MKQFRNQMNTAAAEGSGRGNKADDFSHCWFRFKTNLSFFIFLLSLLLLLQVSSLIFLSTSRWSGLAALATSSTQTAKLLGHRRHVGLRASRGQRTRAPVNEKLSARKTVSVHQQKPFPTTWSEKHPFFMYSLSACASLTTRPSAGGRRPCG